MLTADDDIPNQAFGHDSHERCEYSNLDAFECFNRRVSGPFFLLPLLLLFVGKLSFDHSPPRLCIHYIAVTHYYRTASYIPSSTVYTFLLFSPQFLDTPLSGYFIHGPFVLTLKCCDTEPRVGLIYLWLFTTSILFSLHYSYVYGHTYSKSMDQPSKVANPARGQLDREKWIFLCPRSRLRIWSRETGLAVPPRVSWLISILRLNLVHTYRTSPEFRGGVYLFIKNRHTPSGHSRVYRVTQFRTDGVHCRESAGTGPVNLKLVPNECCFSSSPYTN